MNSSKDSEIYRNGHMARIIEGDMSHPKDSANSTTAHPPKILTTGLDWSQRYAIDALSSNILPINSDETWDPEPLGWDDLDAHTAWGRRYFGDDWPASRAQMIAEAKEDVLIYDAYDDQYHDRQQDLRIIETTRQNGHLPIPCKTYQELMAWAHTHYGDEFMRCRNRLAELNKKKLKVRDAPERLGLDDPDSVRAVEGDLGSVEKEIERQRRRMLRFARGVDKGLIKRRRSLFREIKPPQVSLDRIVDVQLEYWVPEIREILKMHRDESAPTPPSQPHAFTYLEWRSIHKVPHPDDEEEYRKTRLWKLWHLRMEYEDHLVHLRIRKEEDAELEELMGFKERIRKDPVKKAELVKQIHAERVEKAPAQQTADKKVAVLSSSGSGVWRSRRIAGKAPEFGELMKPSGVKKNSLKSGARAFRK